MPKNHRIFCFILLFSLCAAGCSLKPPKSAKGEPTITLFIEDKGERTSLGMEEYVAGVVAAEVGDDAPLEALKAQAILARTFALQRIEEKGGTQELHGTDACTDPEHFQAYDETKLTDRIKEAAQATRGLIVMHNGKPALTWFHANSGGITATPLEGLNFRETEITYLKPVKDALDDPGAWEHTFSLKEVSEALHKLGVEASGISTVQIGQTGPSGRATVLQIDQNTVSAPEFRNQIGSKLMRSMLLDSISVTNDAVTMKGKGWGHGVGMSQEGAKALAEQGKSAREIILHYFDGVSLEERWK